MAIQIITSSLPNATHSVAYSQTVQTSGGVAPLVFSHTGSLPTGLTLGTSTGAITGTPSANGAFTFTVTVTDDDSFTDSQSYTINVYNALNPSPDPLPGDTAVYVEAGDQLQFSAVGGSGSYQWSVDGGNLINSVSGLLTALNGGTFTVTLVDTVSGQVTTINLVVTSQSQFCVQGVPVDASGDATDDTCCELNVECGDRIQLQVPSFYVVTNGVKSPVFYSNVVQAVTGASSALQSTSSNAGASGNEASFNRDAIFEIVTSFDMAQTANGEFAIGWSGTDIDTLVSSIEHSVVWFTDGSDRKVELRHFGIAEADSQFDISQGDAVSFGVVDGALRLFINDVLVFTSSESYLTCGDVVLDISIVDANKTIGGYVTNLTWVVTTSGTAGEVGSVDANGVYTSPSNPIVGIVKAKGSLNNANFYINIRNIQPTPKFTKPGAFLQGRRAQVWVTNKRATDNEIIRLASDGTPDALQNPGMIYLGVLEASATFAEDNQTQDFTNDEGIYQTVITEERATLQGSFLEVRDLDKLAVMMQHATLYPKVKGVTEFAVGGKSCGGCDLRAVLIVESGPCGSGWDVIYMPRVQNTGNLSLEIGKKASAKYALNFRVLPDPTRTSGKQLYSIYQMSNCSDSAVGSSCDVGE